MDTQPAYGIRNVIASIAGQVADSVSERPGESLQRRDDRKRTAVDTIMAFRPGDPVEAILSSHCVMFHEMIVADVHHTLCNEQRPTQRATRNGIVAMDKAFGANFTRLRQHRAPRPRQMQPGDGLAETDIADRIRRHQSQIEPENREPIETDCEPSEADVAADAWPTTAQMPGLNRQARRALDRQSRKRAFGQPAPGLTPDRNAATTIPSATSAG
jgi:hypothetical protein